MITIILPVYNDWPSLSKVLNILEKVKKREKIKINIIIINDCSTTKINFNNYYNLNKIYFLNLKKNIGSQKAIATGIKFATKNKIDKHFVIMDSDGEDNPFKVSEIIKFKKKKKVDIITMNRTTRHESFLFSILYELHIFLTLLLTWRYIRFGNFTYLNLKSMKFISRKKDIWMAYSATIAKYFHKRNKLEAPRKKRFSGKSKMKYWQLFFHSFRILSVFKNRILFNTALYLILIKFIFNLSYLSTFFLISLCALSTINLIILLIDLTFYSSRLKLFNCLKNIKSVKVK